MKPKLRNLIPALILLLIAVGAAVGLIITYHSPWVGAE